jgi:hypothetical protein
VLNDAAGSRGESGCCPMGKVEGSCDLCEMRGGANTGVDASLVDPKLYRVILQV